MFAGYAPEPVVEAVSRRVARGTQFLLPNEDAPWVAEELGRRYGLPKWQFTLSATHANTEAIRIARALTGRDKVLFFDGKYHGHFDEALVDLQDGKLVPEEAGLPRDVTSKTKVVQFNDPDALRTRPGAARRRDRDHGADADEQRRPAAAGARVPRRAAGDHARDRHRAAYDETHTQVVGPGGLTEMWSLDPDMVTIGKSIARRRAARRLRHDRVHRRHHAAPGRAVRREGGDRDRRHAVRQPALHGGGAGDDGVRS